MPVVSVSVSEDIKQRMEKLKYINWSEVLRQAILNVLEREEKRNIIKAVLLNERVRKKAPKGWDSSKVIRSWRRSIEITS